MEDFYELLGVPRTADQDTIRKAYRRLAIRWHPDKNPGDSFTAEVMFKKIAAAYETLGDGQRRAEYDEEVELRKRGGEESRFNQRRGSAQHAPGPEFGFAGHFHHDPFDIFREAFGEDDPFANDPFFNRNGGGVFGGSSTGAHESFFVNRDPFQSAFSGMGFGVPFFDQHTLHQGRDDRRGGAHGGVVHDAGSNFHTRVSSSSASRGAGGAGVSRSTSMQTVIINGRRSTRTTTTVRHVDGRTETFTDEHTDDGFPAERRVAGNRGHGSLSGGNGSGHSRLTRGGYF